MRPRPFAAENWLIASPNRIEPSSFNEAAAFRRGEPGRTRACGIEGRSFNEAAALRRGDRVVWEITPSRFRGFNEAAAFRRGERRGAADRRCRHARFNEAAAFRRGEPLTLLAARNLSHPDASMRPRPFAAENAAMGHRPCC